MDTGMSDRVRDLLRLAVQSLEAGPSSGSKSTSQASPATSRTEVPALSERNTLFNYTGKRKGKSSLQNKAKRKITLWTHSFICLSSTDTCRPPTSMQMAELMRAGLGRKELHIIDGGDSSDVHSEIIYAFPKLRDAGGYELLRISDANRSVLQLIPPLSEGYTVPYLKEVLKQAKVYIRPLQRSLTLDQVPSSSITFQELSEHIRICKRKPSMEVKSDDDDDDDDDGCMEDPPFNDDPIVNLDSPIAPAVAELNKEEAPNQVLKEPCSLNDIMSQLSMNIVNEEFQVQVGRESVLDDLLLLSESVIESLASKRLTVTFLGEPGVDVGGVTREMWSLFVKGVQSLCDGRDTCKIPRHNTLLLRDGVYRKLGMLMGVCIIQSGSGFTFFSPSVYQYLSGTKNYRSINPAPEEIPDKNILSLLNKLSLASDDTSLRTLAMDNCDNLLSCGYLKPIHTITCKDLSTLVAAVSFHCVISSVKAELDDIRDGLAKVNILYAMEAFPQSLELYFVKKSTPLTAAQVLNLFEIKRFSEPGSSTFQMEQATYNQFRDLLREMERGSVLTTLSQLLNFYTGSNEIPPTGFDLSSTLQFSNTIDLPTASTCSLCLTIPTQYFDKYDVFKEKMLWELSTMGDLDFIELVILYILSIPHLQLNSLTFHLSHVLM
ncbi:PREDICTED: uncharacterized protein LOC105314041 isoform X2 [Amphimedon queenslandica]|uniref:HECT domain-containing protein n=1 Tax=Amphimedon queenslandica TaxID=400682 RepID=A0AAN0JHM6_AMPQE|nr:PREDICTED: uncharacterized protein LOC105314041 isoform X2 [Amphimedon queenslandica]|eukprot:XP_019856540.1 PREDICTED: uncharacterized protein LOC105314041 isoform X2 [Amphimedon queenslandica]